MESFTPLVSHHPLMHPFNNKHAESPGFSPLGKTFEQHLQSLIFSYNIDANRCTCNILNQLNEIYHTVFSTKIQLPFFSSKQHSENNLALFKQLPSDKSRAGF